jgi:hypothetical protein
MHLQDYRYGDAGEVSPDTEQELIDGYESDQCYLRSFYDEDSSHPFAVGMCTRKGEVGLLIDCIPGSPKEFYTLVVLFCAEAFSFAGTDALYTGFDPNERDTRWKRFLGMQVAERQWPTHTERGWVTHQFSLSNWVR